MPVECEGQTDEYLDFLYPDPGQCGFTQPIQSVLIITNVVSLNPTHDQVYSIQHYVMKFVSDLRQVGS